MKRDEAHRLDYLEDEIREIKDWIEELKEEKKQNAYVADPLATTYPSALDDHINTAAPRWVKDMFLELCSEMFAAKSEEHFHAGRMSTAHAVRFVLYYAVKYPERIEYVSLKELRHIKKDMDEE